jgi:DNA mismatch endonuclease (patch repair protein)
MSRVRSKNNKSTELALIKVFKAQNIKGWRRGYKVKGCPDFVFLEKKTVVFVDGCFWHGHDCRNTRPSDNKEFWAHKREKNIARDAETTERFKKRGWSVIRIWECELRKNNRNVLLGKIVLLK